MKNYLNNYFKLLILPDIAAMASSRKTFIEATNLLYKGTTQLSRSGATIRIALMTIDSNFDGDLQ